MDNDTRFLRAVPGGGKPKQNGFAGLHWEAGKSHGAESKMLSAPFFISAREEAAPCWNLIWNNRLIFCPRTG